MITDFETKDNVKEQNEIRSNICKILNNFHFKSAIDKVYINIKIMK